MAVPVPEVAVPDAHATHEPPLTEYVPGPQLKQEPEPAELDVPAPHAEHEPVLDGLMVPALH